MVIQDQSIIHSLFILNMLIKTSKLNMGCTLDYCINEDNSEHKLPCRYTGYGVNNRARSWNHDP